MRGREGRRLRRGSPARAGMHPCRSRHSGARRRFPRTRGDAPLLSAANVRFLRVPPHARGCTRHHRVGERHGPGSPARAGMHPGPTSSRPRCRRFPRTRGDAPWSAPGSQSRSTVPPHARGCTQAAPTQPRGELGSPARAGMHPTSPRARPSTARFPRTRGDAPRLILDAVLTVTVPPHARGCTPLVGLARGSAPGSPARAGMHRRRLDDRPPHRGFPRTRGDAPQVVGCGMYCPPVPPHARGCAPVDLSSLLAGGFPRTRGDAPLRDIMMARYQAGHGAGASQRKPPPVATARGECGVVGARGDRGADDLRTPYPCGLSHDALARRLPLRRRGGTFAAARSRRR